MILLLLLLLLLYIDIDVVVDDELLLLFGVAVVDGDDRSINVGMSILSRDLALS